MGAIKDSIKIVEMSEHEVDTFKAIIDELDLSDEDKAAINYGLNLGRVLILLRGLKVGII